MTRYFIDNPIVGWVIAIILMLSGLLALHSLPIGQFPAIAPPAVTITATYPGADAQTLDATTTQLIERQMKGIDGLRYFSSTSSSAGAVTITLTFEQGTDPDIAQVQVQNKLQQATPLLPQEVQKQGIIVAKSTENVLFVGLYSENARHNGDDLSDYVVSKLQDPISRVKGVGETAVFGSQYAMRIWIDPLKLEKYALTVADVRAAVIAQNAQVSAGQIGAQPAPREQMLNATVSVQSRLTTPDQFAAISLKSNVDGSIVRLGDVARIEIGAENYGIQSEWNGKPASGIGIKLAPGANALATVLAVKARALEIGKQFPSDVKVIFPYDTSPFVQLSIRQVIETLFEAIVLVFLVMFLFLQNLRATLIPTIAVPVVLLGTFAVLALAGFSINTLTLFGMVLAIGLLVDDAIHSAILFRQRLDHVSFAPSRKKRIPLISRFDEIPKK
jgi:multidrug efflux pump